MPNSKAGKNLIWVDEIQVMCTLGRPTAETKAFGRNWKYLERETEGNVSDQNV